MTEEQDGLPLDKLKRRFTQNIQLNTDENDESRSAWAYYHGSQLTEKQRKIYKDREQPEIIFNRTARKIDGLVGVMQRLRADPKASPRNPRIEQSSAGAELATAVIRSVLDANKWEFIEPTVIRNAAVHGIGVYELGLRDSPRSGDVEITVAAVDPRTFFYEKRAIEYDFASSRDFGVNRWVDTDELDELFPGAADMAMSDVGDVGGTVHDSDLEKLWTDEKRRRRLVEHWYKWRGEWWYCFYVGSTKLAGGISPFRDEYGRTMHRYVPWSAAVDQDGDRYGFVRNLKGPQDAMNQHRSKAMHLMNSYKLFLQRGTFGDVDDVRRELHKAGSVVEYDGQRDGFEYILPSAEFLQQTQYFQDARLEIESFGPTQGLTGDFGNAESGRMLAIMQQSGLAELGMFPISHRHAKLELYSKIWSIAVEHYHAERWIRLSSDEETAQFIGINVMQFGQDGLPEIINSLGSIDVDIILDEGPDTTTVMGDVYDTMLALATNGVPIPPQAIIEMSNLPKSVKDKLLEMMQPKLPGPEQQAAMALEFEGAKAKVDKVKADTDKVRAETMGAMREMMAPEMPEPAGAPGISMSEAMTGAAKAEDLLAAADLKRAQTAKIVQEIELEPARMAREMMNDAVRQMPRDETRVS